MRQINSQKGGYTLAEMMVAASVGSLLMALAVSSTILIQKVFLASDFHAVAQNDQLRLSDYLSLDLRPATSVVISRGGQQLDLHVPAQDAPILGIHLNVPVLGPLLLGGTPPPDRQIRYSLSGSDLYREEAGKRILIAHNLAEFSAVRAGSVVNITSSFSPQYSQNPTRAPREFTSLRQKLLVRYAAD